MLLQIYVITGPEPHGVHKAHLSKDVRPFVEEIALSEQVTAAVQLPS